MDGIHAQPAQPAAPDPTAPLEPWAIDFFATLDAIKAGTLVENPMAMYVRATAALDCAIYFDRLVAALQVATRGGVPLIDPRDDLEFFVRRHNERWRAICRVSRRDALLAERRFWVRAAFIWWMLPACACAPEVERLRLEFIAWKEGEDIAMENGV